MPEPHCIFEGVRKLPPGHRLTWDAGRASHIERYWSPLRAERADVGDERGDRGSCARCCASRSRCTSSRDVPLGAFLSGGIDSSTVVAQMAQLVPGRVKTFSIGFDEPSYNEAPHARARRARRSAPSTRSSSSARTRTSSWTRSITRFDEPFGDSSALPTFLVSQMAREHVTVALSGDGGDELFGGYTRYAELLSRRELPGVRQHPRIAPGRGAPAAWRTRTEPPAGHVAHAAGRDTRRRSPCPRTCARAGC